jgi:hypothetical protein
MRMKPLTLVPVTRPAIPTRPPLMTINGHDTNHARNDQAAASPAVSQQLNGKPAGPSISHPSNRLPTASASSNSNVPILPQLRVDDAPIVRFSSSAGLIASIPHAPAAATPAKRKLIDCITIDDDEDEMTERKMPLVDDTAMAVRGDHAHDASTAPPDESELVPPFRSKRLKMGSPPLEDASHDGRYASVATASEVSHFQCGPIDGAARSKSNGSSSSMMDDAPADVHYERKQPESSTRALQPSIIPPTLSPIQPSRNASISASAPASASAATAAPTAVSLAIAPSHPISPVAVQRTIQLTSIESPPADVASRAHKLAITISPFAMLQTASAAVLSGQSQLIIARTT